MDERHPRMIHEDQCTTQEGARITTEKHLYSTQASLTDLLMPGAHVCRLVLVMVTDRSWPSPLIFLGIHWRIRSNAATVRCTLDCSFLAFCKASWPRGKLGLWRDHVQSTRLTTWAQWPDGFCARGVFQEVGGGERMVCLQFGEVFPETERGQCFQLLCLQFIWILNFCFGLFIKWAIFIIVDALLPFPSHATL